MDEKFLEFARLLRDNGVRVSPGESLDALTALSVVGIESRALVKDTLRATMIKRSVDIDIFDQLFELYFRGVGELLKAASTRGREAAGLDRARFQEMLERFAKILEEPGRELSGAAREWLEDDQGRFAQRFREAIQQVGQGQAGRGDRPGLFVLALADQMGIHELLGELELLRVELPSASGLSEEERHTLLRYLEQRSRDLIHLVKQAVGNELDKADLQRREEKRLSSLGEKSFYYLTEEEIRRMKEAVSMLARRLRNVVATRRRKAGRGRFNVKDTLRKNLQYGGVPFRIQLDRKRKEKPQVVILCDVSDSVRNVSRFMLQLVYSLQGLYSRVRSYIFVAEPGEITSLFEENEIHEAIDLALRGNVINLFAHSDFGKTFQMFHRDHLASVTRRTTVIILGDARNNYNIANEWVLGAIRNRAKQLIWLNPESELTWGFGDSDIEKYRPHCDIVVECRNLNQLYRVVDRIVLT